MNAVPIAVLSAFASAIPRIEAGEQLTAIETAALGGGLVEQRARAKALSGIERRAIGGAAPARAKADIGSLAAMGIGVVPEPLNDVLEGDEGAVKDG